MKHLLNKQLPTRSVKFLGDTVEVKPFTIRDARLLEKSSSGLEEKDTEQKLEFMYQLFRDFVVGAEDMTTEDFEGFPADALSDLVTEITNSVGGEGNG